MSDARGSVIYLVLKRFRQSATALLRREADSIESNELRHRQTMLLEIALMFGRVFLPSYP
jgi:hypothetical protein